jgi:PhoH-like ATPase
VTFLRGRSLQRQIVVIDEAQNLEPTTLRTILTRVGQGTKVIFTGDTSQIDAPYLPLRSRYTPRTSVQVLDSGLALFILLLFSKASTSFSAATSLMPALSTVAGLDWSRKIWAGLGRRMERRSA